MKSHQNILSTAAIFGGLAVVIGAFGAHGLKGKISSESLVSFDIAVKYQFYHVFAILTTGLYFIQKPSKHLTWAVWLFAIGILLFSGSIYFLSTREIHGLQSTLIGIVTPIGGVCFIAGWSLLAYIFSRR